MLSISFGKLSNVVLFVAAIGYTCASSAHDAGATMDPNGTVAGFTGFALVTCTNSGSIPTSFLEASITDTSLPQDNLLVNLQIIHIGNNFNHAISTTDPISGDAEPSPSVRVAGGNGNYLLLVNKTAAGARSFTVSYHCKAADGVTHTDTDILVYQFE
ncbi:hypothetical protein [Nitrosomonas sp.]|uniref:hypothetical protein n=1 Tax=Nitrosomonas sp. TaxID=42353 RepID=UPI002626C1E1|nr:hypothetical protein [Nitrosomonas sp.]